MKIKEGFILRKIDNTGVVVPVGDAVQNFEGMIILNETGIFLWERLLNDAEASDLASSLTSEYGVDAETAERDVNAFLRKVRGAGLLAEQTRSRDTQHRK